MVELPGDTVELSLVIKAGSDDSVLSSEGQRTAEVAEGLDCGSSAPLHASRIGGALERQRG